MVCGLGHFQSTDHSQSLPFPKHRSFTKLAISKPQTIHKACHFQSTDHSQSLPFPKHRSFTKLVVSKPNNKNSFMLAKHFLGFYMASCVNDL
jgi:hypothetical protein